jgi:hypothetical protein
MWHETEEMHTVKTLLMAINLQVVKGEINVEDYNGFLKSLNDDISPNFKIAERRKKCQRK